MDIFVLIITQNLDSVYNSGILFINILNVFMLFAIIKVFDFNNINIKREFFKL